MSEPVRKTVKYRGVEYNETVDYTYYHEPSKKRGLVTWAFDKAVMGKILPGLSVAFDPMNKESLEEARNDIKCTIDLMRGGDKIAYQEGAKE